MEQNKNQGNITAKNKYVGKILLGVFIAILLSIIVAIGIYLGTYYHASFDVEQMVSQCEQQGITVDQMKNGEIVFMPQNPSAGLIFYPGAKVEYTAYIPLMEEFAKRDILCVLVHMPCNMAFFNKDAAEGIQEQYPNIGKWYLGGHSLGGAMAAAYLENHAQQYEGFLLLASYSTIDLSGLGLKILSVYGSEDGVMQADNYKIYKKNLPKDYQELIIKGGCHAYFGMYGPQKGDGQPTIDVKEQMVQTANAFEQMISQ